MARLPGVADLGPLPTPEASRPIGTYDVSAFAAGGEALARGGQQLGAGISKMASGIDDAATAENRWDYATAHSDFVTRKMDLDEAMRTDTNYGPDDSGKALPERYQDAVTKLQDQSAGLIQSSPMRNRFMLDTNPVVEQGFIAAQQHARAQANDASIAYVTQQGDAIMNRAVQSPDDDARRTLIDSHNQLVDGLVAKGAINQVQALQMKKEWAQQYATADLLARADSDPQSVVNELRAAPGSSDQITGRIIAIEGQGKNSKSSSSGTGGFTNGTWLDVLKRNRPDLAQGKSDADLLALKADDNLATDMTTVYQKENSAYLQKQGLPVTPGNIYLSHFLGPAGAAAVLQADPNMPVADALSKALGPDKAKAMVEANPKVLGGKLVGSVTEWSDGKMGGVGPGGGSIYDLLRPDVREQLLAKAQTNLQKQTVTDLSDFKGKVEDSQAEAARTGTVTNPLSLSDFVGHLGAETGPKAYSNYQANLQLGRDIQSVASLNPDQQQALLQSYEPKPGTGFADAAARQDALKKAIATARAVRVNDPDFKSRIESTVTEAARTGNVTNPLTPEEFDFHLGPSDGPKAYAHYSASLRLGHDVKRVDELSPDEEAGLLKDYEPKPGEDFAAAAERRDVLAKAIARSNADRVNDPGGFAAAHLPATQDAYKGYQTAVSGAAQPVSPDGGAQAQATQQMSPQAAARRFATTTLLEQQQAGIPPDQRQILPKADVDRFNAAVTAAASSDDPKARVGLIKQIQDQATIWGDHWPDVMRQLAPEASPMVRAIAAGADPAAMTRLLQLDPKQNPAAILKEQNEVTSKNVRSALNTAMAPMLSTMVGRQRDRDFADYYNLADKLAALNVRDGMPAEKAADAAFNALIGNRYDFRDTYRIPKSGDYTADNVQAGALAAKFKLAELGAKPAIDDMPGITNGGADSLAKFGRDGVWVTSPHNDGLNMMYGDKAVRGQDGAPLFVSWGQLAKMGGTPEARTEAARRSAASYAPAQSF